MKTENRNKKPYKFKSDESKYYISADELLKETLLSKQNCQMSDRFAQLLMTLHNHILLRDEFKSKNEDEKQEIKSWSIFTITKYISRGLKTFKDHCTTRECFNYFTRSARLNMIRRS
jgi:hypothetical protein